MDQKLVAPAVHVAVAVVNVTVEITVGVPTVNARRALV